LSKYDPVKAPYSLSYDEKQTLLNFARRYPLLGESRAAEIAGIYAPYLRGSNNNTSDSALLLGIARNLSGEHPLSKKSPVLKPPATEGEK
jgi:hypothetical protein